MQFVYTIIYVEDVEKTLSFYERAFGMKRKMNHENNYGELETGTTKLAFARKGHVKKLLPIAFQDYSIDSAPPAVEIGLITKDVQIAFDKAVEAGALPVKEPLQKPWGQVVGYVRDTNGFQSNSARQWND